jgi:hypothetical protein
LLGALKRLQRGDYAKELTAEDLNVFAAALESFERAKHSQRPSGGWPRRWSTQPQSCYRGFSPRR